MTRLIAGLSTFLLLCPAYAVDVKDAPPPESVNVLGIIIFFVIMIAMTVGFFGYMWWRSKHGKDE